MKRPLKNASPLKLSKHEEKQRGEWAGWGGEGGGAGESHERVSRKGV